MISLSPLPTAHPSLFQQAPVRSSRKFYLPFNLAMGRSRGFGSIPCNCTPCSDSLSLRLRCLCTLTLLQKITRGPIMQKVRRHTPLRGAPTACRQTVSGSISLPSPGFFSPFPHGTGSLSVIEEYLALADGPAGFTPGFTCPVLLGIHAHWDLISTTGLSPSLDGPSSPLIYRFPAKCASHNPEGLATFGLGCSAFARRY